MVVGGQDVTPSDDHHVRIDPCIILACRSGCGPEPALDPVALRRMADPPGDREAEAEAPGQILAQAALDRHPPGMKGAVRGLRLIRLRSVAWPTRLVTVRPKRRPRARSSRRRPWTVILSV